MWQDCIHIHVTLLVVSTYTQKRQRRMLQTPKERRERCHMLYRMCNLGQKCFMVTAYVSNYNLLQYDWY